MAQSKWHLRKVYEKYWQSSENISHRKQSSFLINCRQTPHSTTGQPPSLLMFGRQTRSKLPTTSTTPSHNQQTLYELTKLTDSFQKQKMKNSC